VTAEAYGWWAALRHGGLLIAPTRLAEHFPEEPPRLPDVTADRLRRELTRLAAGVPDAETAVLDVVLHRICGLTDEDGARWERGTGVDARWAVRVATGDMVKPRRVWYGPHGVCLPVFADDAPRLGVGRGRHPVSRVLQWLRTTEQPVALLSNARQWRLVYAGLDIDAWAEWDVDLWFEEGRPGPQVTALQQLLAPRALTPPRPGEPGPLLAAIRASRRGQAELSAELGERVRLAIELLIQEHGPRLDRFPAGTVSPRDIYLAATRVVMRMVVILFAEARDLLPRDNPVYHASYGLQGLREVLERVGGAAAERLRLRFGGWPRVLALFQLVHQGSHHEALPVPRYGGDLFAPGDPEGADPVARALAVFEDPGRDHPISDAVVHQVLERLCRSRVRVRHGAGSIWVSVPVDFSDLSSEYIGILYEGLLDYELRRAEAPQVFLALGDEPALPLSRLEAMDAGALPALLAKLKVKRRLAVAEDEKTDEGDAVGDDEEEEAAAEDAPAEAEDAAATEAAEAVTADDSEDARRAARTRALAWARRAVIEGKVVPKPRSQKAEALRDWERAIEAAAGRLIPRVVLSGEWFLVRWGGTRKGAGTFYTRPQLAVPLTQRTLRPLAHDVPRDRHGKPREDAPPAAWTPKLPEAILALKVCDPAVGSGSFLVASLRFLTDALFASLHHHGRIRPQGEATVVTLAEGRPSTDALAEELLPCRPDAEDFEPRLRARLKRHVVERCLYGVDIDPLAVELAKLALWIETMDRSLPFEFLDHKLRPGNSLVGSWFDRFRHYPVLAWEREGGDKAHANGVHCEREAWTKAIRRMRGGVVKTELAAWIAGQVSLFDPIDGRSPEAIHDDAVAVYETLHALPVQEADRRATLYHDHIRRDPAVTRLRTAFDTWCAVWFWPAAQLAAAPPPGTFGSPADAARVVVADLAREHRFFHWELEFPDVFASAGGGFDAVVGNPPWEIQKPSSREYFSNLDPLYRTYGKQEALQVQTALFEGSEAEERRWLEYNARFRALANWVKHVGEPFGDPAAGGERFPLGPGSAHLHVRWRERRRQHGGYADPDHPCRHQGSADLNTYKLFFEQAFAVLRAGGQLGMLAPSGLYTDKGATALRDLFLGRGRWRWLFGFENRERIFDIDSRFKFGPVIVEKGGETESIRTAFMRRDLDDWAQAERHAIPYRRAQVERFSPRTRTLLEIRARRDLEILEKLYANGVLLGDEGPEGWGIRYATEFHMTNDSKLFPPRPAWEARGYRPDEYGRWITARRVSPDLERAAEPGWIRLADGSGVVYEADIEDMALPLYEGRMIGQFDFSEKGWVSGKGRGAVWREIPWDRKVIEPQYLMGTETVSDSQKSYGHAKVAYMRISSATNARTTIAAYLNGVPAGDSVFFFRSNAHSAADCLSVVAIFNTMVFDYQARSRLGGLNMSEFMMVETAVPPRTRVGVAWSPLLHLARRLALPFRGFAPDWLCLVGALSPGGLSARRSWKGLWAVTLAERLRLRCMLDALMAEFYGLDWDDLVWVLRDCDHPTESLREKAFGRSVDPKGFWRIDRAVDPELRHPVLTLVAFRDLKDAIATHGGDRDRGLRAFCEQHDGDGWMLPEVLRLDDLGLGHDQRAKQLQPVRERLGPRFLAWQLEQSVEDSWAECERHARNLLGEEGFRQLQNQVSARTSGEAGIGPAVAEAPAQYHASSGQGSLFGEPRPTGRRAR
jgi:hypothetical protein